MINTERKGFKRVGEVPVILPMTYFLCFSEEGEVAVKRVPREEKISITQLRLH
jgi:hypothetical protein